jgi:hypothetical protein
LPAEKLVLVVLLSEEPENLFQVLGNEAMPEKNRPLESGLSLLGEECPWGRACDDEGVAFSIALNSSACCGVSHTAQRCADNAV